VVRRYLDETAEAVGEVYKGLLVVHGVHARLNNISEDGKWLKSESFIYKNKLVERKEGQSVGNIMSPWRKLRQTHPDLFKSVTVMAQPASNVDSVIMSWAVEEQSEDFPCSVFQRDCFAAAFSEPVSHALFLGQQLQCTIAAKMTASLQLTDTDFSKKYKSECRKVMDRMRLEGEAKLGKAGQNESWQAGPFEILSAVVQAQAQMSESNLLDNWVMAGLMRNGILAYKPSLSQNKLIPFTEVSCLKRLNFGTSRMRDWLLKRFAWLDEKGKPLSPDWSLAEGAKEVSDLMEWDYHNPEVAVKDEDYLLAVEDLPIEFKLTCFEQGLLQLPLDLQKAAKRRAEDPAYNIEVAAEKRSKRKQKITQRMQRKNLGKKEQEKLREKLRTMSRAEAFNELVPLASSSSAKRRHSQLRTDFKSIALKLAQKKKQNELANASGKQLPEVEPPLPPPSEPPPATATAFQNDTQISEDADIGVHV
jgi:hypothetical protein